MSGPASAPDAGKALPGEIEQLARTPLLPIERPLVKTVRGLEAMRGQVEVLLMLLEQCPGATDQINAAWAALAEHGNGAYAALMQFQEIRSCRGQA